MGIDSERGWAEVWACPCVCAQRYVCALLGVHLLELESIRVNQCFLGALLYCCYSITSFHSFERPFCTCAAVGCPDPDLQVYCHMLCYLNIRVHHWEWLNIFYFHDYFSQVTKQFQDVQLLWGKNCEAWGHVPICLKHDTQWWSLEIRFVSVSVF